MNSEALGIVLSRCSATQKIVCVFGAWLILMFCLPAFSQSEQGRVYGGITDQTGGAIVGATVTVVDVARGVSRTLITDDAGAYNAPNLLPGDYTIRAEAKGFQSIERQNVQVQVGGELRVDLTLKPGEQTQTITVTEALPMINTTNASLGGTIENKEVIDLPINGRNFQNMEDFRPGISSKPGGTPSGRSTNGLPGKATSYMLEGQWNKAVYSGTAIIGGTNNVGEGSTVVNLDAIQEFTLVENPKAEYGWDEGIVLNIGLKSGTNSLHGTAFAYGRTGALDARNPFTPTQPELLSLEQFGGVLGGKFIKDKLFYFISYEGHRLTEGQAGQIQVPTTASIGAGDPSNSFVDAINAMIATGHPRNSLSENLAGCVEVPAVSCNASKGVFGNSTPSQTISGSTPLTSNSDNYIGKLDYHVSDHHYLLAEWLSGSNNTINTSGFVPQPYWARYNPIRATVAQVSENWTPNSAWVNEARFGYHIYNQQIFSQECRTNVGQPDYATAFGLNSGAQQSCDLPTISITGFASLGCGCDPQPRVENTYQVSDSVSYIRGKHAFKFGFEYRHSNAGGLIATGSIGTVKFGGNNVNAFTLPSTATPLEDFLAGDASSAQVLIGSTKRLIQQDFVAGFMQDDWRITPRLTLNLGLRYEYVPPFSEKNNLIASFDPNSATGIVQPGVTPGEPTSIYKADHTNFQPRFGFAWDATGRGNWVVRAGFGVFTAIAVYQGFFENAFIHSIPTGGALYNTAGVNVNAGAAQAGNIATALASINGVSGSTGAPGSAIPWVNNLTNPGNPIFNTTAAVACGEGSLPGVAVPAGLPKEPPQCNGGSVDPNLHRAYSTEWDLSVEHAFTNRLSLDVAYAGTHSTGVLGLVDINQPTPGIGGATNEQQRRPFFQKFPYLATVFSIGNVDFTNYNGLQLTLTQRVSHGVSFSLGYTQSHSLCTYCEDVNLLHMDNTRPGLDYGNSSIDTREHFTIHGSWAIPGRKSPGQILEGWQLNSVLVLQSPIPFNAMDTTNDISGTGINLDRWSLVGNRSAFQQFGGTGTVPCYGIPGSSFGKNSACTQVAQGVTSAVQFMPAACVAAASAEALSPAGVPTSAIAPVNGAAVTAQNTGTFNLAKYGCYVSGGSVIVPPAQGTYGTMETNELYGKGLRQWDASVSKDWKFNERFAAQFRAEFFNVLNRTQYAIPSANLATPNTFGQSQRTGNASNAVNGTGGPRAVQLALKLTF